LSAAARRLIFAGGGGVTKMSAAAASTKNLLCQKAANSKFNPRLKVNLMQRQGMQRSSNNDQQIVIAIPEIPISGNSVFTQVPKFRNFSSKNSGNS
jgi:hypothetical protein